MGWADQRVGDVWPLQLTGPIMQRRAAREEPVDGCVLVSSGGRLPACA